MVSTPPDGALLIVRTDGKMGKTKKRINLLRPRYAVRTAHGARFEAALIPAREKTGYCRKNSLYFLFYACFLSKRLQLPFFCIFPTSFWDLHENHWRWQRWWENCHSCAVTQPGCQPGSFFWEHNGSRVPKSASKSDLCASVLGLTRDRLDSTPHRRTASCSSQLQQELPINSVA